MNLRTLIIAVLCAVLPSACGKPPQKTLTEVYEQGTGAVTFDHDLLDKVVKRIVDADGGVDYDGLKRDPGALDQYIAALGDAPFEELGRDEKLTLLINAYNAFTLRLILDYYPLESIRDIASGDRWDAVRWQIGTMTLSLAQIEHEHLRPNFREPRLHFAINCASVSCPPLRGEAYVAARLDEQLDDQMRYTHARDLWLKLDTANEVVYLTKLYHWYGGDFEQVAPSVQEYAARYNAKLKSLANVNVKWLDYDWSLNVQSKP
jgi:hypothetical protein